MLNLETPRVDIPAVAYAQANITPRKFKHASSFTNNTSKIVSPSKNKVVPKNKIGLTSNFNRDSECKSPCSVSLLRKSQAIPNIFNERITLNQKRYDYKMAKNNSVDNMGYLSNGYESNDNSVIKDTKPIRTTNVSIADHISVKSERSKVYYHQSTLGSHKKISSSKAFTSKKKISKGK
jgi:hypothetical protein